MFDELVKMILGAKFEISLESLVDGDFTSRLVKIHPASRVPILHATVSKDFERKVAQIVFVLGKVSPLITDEIFREYLLRSSYV
jgi:hypothetical protein